MKSYVVIFDVKWYRQGEQFFGSMTVTVAIDAKKANEGLAVVKAYDAIEKADFEITKVFVKELA